MKLQSIIKATVQEICSHRPFSGYLCWRGPPTSTEVALTFDDGPNEEFTPRILDVLAQRNVQATFFLLGSRVQRHPDLVRRIADEGHEIGTHSWDHTSDDLPGQTVRTREALLELGVDTMLFRPPRGQWTPALLWWMARNRYPTVLWSFDSRDALRQRYGEDGVIVAYHRISGGDIMLFHDDNQACLLELPVVLDRIEERGLTPVSVSKLLGRS